MKIFQSLYKETGKCALFLCILLSFEQNCKWILYCFAIRWMMWKLRQRALVRLEEKWTENNIWHNKIFWINYVRVICVKCTKKKKKLERIVELNGLRSWSTGRTLFCFKLYTVLLANVSYKTDVSLLLILPLWWNRLNVALSLYRSDTLILLARSFIRT